MNRKRPDARQRRLVFERARGRCEYCVAQARFSNAPFESDGTLINDPVTGRAAALFNPRRQRWDEHFAWENDYLRLIGLTPTGRATIAVLRMNREQLCNLRWALRQCGKHPPE